MKHLVLLVMLLVAAFAILLVVSPVQAEGPVAAFWHSREACADARAAHWNAYTANLLGPPAMSVTSYQTFTMQAVLVPRRLVAVPEVTVRPSRLVYTPALVYATPIRQTQILNVPVGVEVQALAPRACTQAGPAACTPVRPQACTPARAPIPVPPDPSQ